MWNRRQWEATKAIPDGDGFDVLLEGSGPLVDRYYVWNVGSDGVIKSASDWLGGNQMLSRGYEDAFNLDFDGDGIVGVPPVIDANGDGLVDGGGHYRLYSSGSAIDLKNKRGRTYSDQTNPVWDVVQAIQASDGFKVLLEGSDRLAGRFNVWNVGSDGVIKSGSGWLTANQMVLRGYEDEFVRDIDNDGITGMPLVVDANGDGLVDGDGSYRLFRNGDAVDLVTAGGQSLSDQTNPLWNVTRAVVVDDGFNVLVEGTGRLTDFYLVWSVDSEGVIEPSSGGWSTPSRLIEVGYADLFA